VIGGPGEFVQGPSSCLRLRNDVRVRQGYGGQDGAAGCAQERCARKRVVDL